MKRVFVCSPYRGDISENTLLAQRLCTAAVRQGSAPFAPHLLYPQFLDEHHPEDRTQGILCGLQFLKTCDEVWVYTKNGISSGMEFEIALANIEHIPVVYDPKEWEGV